MREEGSDYSCLLLKTDHINRISLPVTYKVRNSVKRK